MSAKFADGFDHYSIAQVTRKWNNILNGAGKAMSAGRFGGQAFNVANDSGSTRVALVKSLPLNINGWYIGFAFRIDALPGGTSTRNGMCSIRNNATDQMGLSVLGNGQMMVSRGGVTGTDLWQTSNSLSPNQWYYVEWYCFIHPTAGENELRVNGSSSGWVGRVTGAVTSTDGTANSNGITLGLSNFGGGYNGGSWNMLFDDLYVLDNAGGVPNVFLGDTRIQTIYAAGAGAASAWTPSTPPNWSCVNESPPNDDTSFVASGTATQRDLYTFTPLAAPPASIAFLQTNFCARKDDAALRQVSASVHSGAADSDATPQTIGSAYANYSDLWQTDPATGAAWTAAGVAAAQFGLREQA